MVESGGTQFCWHKDTCNRTLTIEHSKSYHYLVTWLLAFDLADHPRMLSAASRRREAAGTKITNHHSHHSK